MTTRGQNLRSTVTGAIPAPATRQPGELWLNFADLQIGAIDTARNAQKLVAVRFFSTLANYAIGDMVVQAAGIYIANVAITAGAFNAANWTRVVTAGDAAGLMPIAGGTFTGPVTLAGAPTVALHAATKAYVDALSSGLAAQFVDVTGDTMSGGLSIQNAFPQINLNKTSAANAVAIWGLLNSVPRWTLQLGAAGGETGSNIGSDFGIWPYNDAGGSLNGGPSLGITRASGYVTINGYGATEGAKSTTANAGNAGVVLNGLVGKPNFINATKNGSTRWQILLGGAEAEGGANTGCDFSINTFSDNGSGIGTALGIRRSDRLASFGGAITAQGSLNGTNNVNAIASSASMNPIIQAVKQDGTAIARMYTLGTANVAYFDNPTTGVSLSMGGQFGFNGNATFFASVGVNANLSVQGTFGVAGAANVNSTFTVQGVSTFYGGMSTATGINYNWVGANGMRFGWDSANTYVMVGIDASNVGNMVTSYQPTQIRGLALNGGNQNMYAYYANSNVHWAFIWNLYLSDEAESEFDALEAINSLAVKSVKFIPITDDDNEPERHWPVALMRNDIKAKMGFAAIEDPKLYKDARTHQDDPDGGEPIPIPAMQTTPLEFKTEPMIAALVRAVQQLTARVAELEGSAQHA